MATDPYAAYGRQAAPHTQRDSIDFGALIGPVATELWGEPNRRLSRPGEMRWGNQGARIVYPNTGAFKDTEANCEGGTLALIEHVQKVDRAGAMAWLAERDFIQPAEVARMRFGPQAAATPAAQHAVRLGAGQRIVATFQYRCGGELRYRKHRIEPGRNGRSKEFTFDHRGLDGSWASGRGNAAVPYRADTLADAPVIIMAEGEAKADKLAAWGFVATSLKDWRDDFGEYVRGKRVVILRDNDESGASQADSAAIMVRAVEGQAVVLDLPRLPPKGDILDWDGDAAELTSLIATVTFPAAPTFPLADLSLWSRISATPTPFYMAGHIPFGEVTLLTGAGGGNKSTFGQQIATCSAAGLPMLGVDVMQGAALYVTAEDHDDRLHWMQEHICKSLGVDMADLDGKLFLASIRGRLNNELATFDADGRLQVREALKLLRSTLEATSAKLLVLDNVAHLFAGNENDRGQVTAFVNLLYSLCRDLDVTILLIAHRNKAGDSYSGSTAWLNAVRSQLLLDRPQDDTDPDARVLTIGKANYARPDQQLLFRWHDFALILDTDLPEDKRAEIAAIIAANTENAAFLACLAERNKQRRHVSEKPTASNYAPKQFENMPEAKNLGRRRLEIAMDRLFRIGAIERGFLYRDTSEGKDIHGLREAGEFPESSPEGSRKVLPDGSGNPQDTTGNTPPYTTYNRGAAHGPAAPLPTWHENPALGRRSRMILAPGETDDEPIPGMEDWP